MLFLLVATLSGTVIAASPRTDVPPVRARAALPRPSGAEIDLLLRAPDRRVRATDSRLAKMLELGARRSPTFAGLLAALARTDVIVYIESTHALPPTVEGQLLLLPLEHHQRYLRIQVRANFAGEELIPLIAHELRHALEVAEEPDVRDDAGMIALYRRIGESSVRGHSYDTAAARETGRQVRIEMAA